jgi:hypothetical protein
VIDQINLRKGTAVSNTYQKKTSKTTLPAEPVVPGQVSVALGEIACAAKEGLLALAVGTGLQVMSAMFDADAEALCGQRGKHKPGRPGWSGARTQRRSARRSRCSGSARRRGARARWPEGDGATAAGARRRRHR